MATSARRTSQLGVTTTLAVDDRVVVLTNPANTTIANTQTITIANFIDSVGGGLPGPYADDTVASGAGVIVTGLYYDATGNVKIRLT
jgi:hypothetical protein